MIKWLRLGLRGQLVIAMVGSIIITVLITMVVSTALQPWVDYEFEKGLSSEAIKANADIKAYRVPTDLRAARELLDRSRKLDKELEYVGYIIFLAVALLSILIGSAIALMLATRIGRPLDAVSTAAKQVAAGDLSARAVVVSGIGGETARLVDNFNTMAASLERFQRQSVESSAAIAHELRTPLAILRGRLQGIHDGIFQRQNNDINLLIVQVESLTQIVEDLRIVSLATAGQLTIVCEPMEAATEIGLLLITMRPALEAAGFYVGIDLAPCMIDADPNRIRQAALALIENARTHAEVGRAIQIETLSEGEDAIIRVSDRGPGIPLDQIERIFEPFWRGDASRNRASGGSGLGLSVVASIVAAHRGFVSAFPRKGGGVTFELRFPIANGTRNELG
jgi:two-component system, OmpR family, sensor histidine kinase AdeS